MYTAGAQHSSSRLSLWKLAPQEKLLLCVNVAGPGWALPEKRSRPARLQQHQQQACTLREHSTAAVGFHFGGRPHKINYCFMLTSLVLGGLHQGSGVALPTGGRADPAVGNEALAGTRRSVFFSLVPGARWYPTLKPRQSFCMWYIIPHTKTKISRTQGHMDTRAHGHTRTDFFFGMYQLETRFARIITSPASSSRNTSSLLLSCAFSGL